MGGGGAEGKTPVTMACPEESEMRENPFTG